MKWRDNFNGFVFQFEDCYIDVEKFIRLISNYLIWSEETGYEIHWQNSMTMRKKLYTFLVCLLFAEVRSACLPPFSKADLVYWINVSV